jgi:hypothetical protein
MGIIVFIHVSFPFLIIYRWQKNSTKVVSSVILVQKLITFLQGLICMWVTLSSVPCTNNYWLVIPDEFGEHAATWVLCSCCTYLGCILQIKEKGVKELGLLRVKMKEHLSEYACLNYTLENIIYTLIKCQKSLISAITLFRIISTMVLRRCSLCLD